MQVSNQEVSEEEYARTLAKAQRNNSRFVTKGDVQLARERLQHART